MYLSRRKIFVDCAEHLFCLREAHVSGLATCARTLRELPSRRQRLGYAQDGAGPRNKNALSLLPREGCPI